jgi:23S rRNA pseudouridine1911/1915/1917 synthase
MAFIGHPILGDNKYGRKNDFPRLALHAYYIGFIHPQTHKFVEFSTPIPQEFSDFINSKS